MGGTCSKSELTERSSSNNPIDDVSLFNESSRRCNNPHAIPLPDEKTGLTKVTSSYKLSLHSLTTHSTSQRSKRCPDEIILIRHGESLGNVEESAYEVIPDWKIPLTERGRQQAREAGKKVQEIVGNRSVAIYYSPYMRTKQTLNEILGELGRNEILFLREEPRMTEQQFGNFQKKHEMEAMKDEKKKFGKFYYRIPNGESGMDVYNRVSSYIGTLFREFERQEVDQESAGGPIVIVTHGLTLRLFLMRWFHVSVTEFEETSNPDNGDVVVMTRVGSANSIYRNCDNLSENLYYIDQESQRKQNWPERLYDLTQFIPRKKSSSFIGDHDTTSTGAINTSNINFERANCEKILSLKRESEAGFISVYKGMVSDKDPRTSKYESHMPSDSLNAMMSNRQKN